MEDMKIELGKLPMPPIGLHIKAEQPKEEAGAEASTSAVVTNEPAAAVTAHVATTVNTPPKSESEEVAAVTAPEAEPAKETAESNSVVQEEESRTVEPEAEQTAVAEPKRRRKVKTVNAKQFDFAPLIAYISEKALPEEMDEEKREALKAEVRNIRDLKIACERYITNCLVHFIDLSKDTLPAEDVMQIKDILSKLK